MATKLVPLAEVERLSPTCIRILAGNPGKFTLQGTNTYLVGTGAQRLLVDTGEGRPSWRRALARTLAEERAAVSHVLLTHWHWDHVKGVDDVLALCPAARVFKHTPDPGQLPIADGQEFAVAGATLRAVHTPGHTDDHMVFVLRGTPPGGGAEGAEGADEGGAALFTGDNVLGHGTSVFEDLAVYLASLARMKALFAGRAYPGHGPVLDDGPARIQHYIDHRAERERQVLQALRAERPAAAVAAAAEGGAVGAGWTAMDIVKVVYGDTPVELHPAAEKGVIQILDKLTKEGKTAKEEARWAMKVRSPL